MRNLNFRVLLSALCIASIMAAFTGVDAAPVRFDQVVQVVNARPDQANATSFTRLTVANDYSFLIGDDDDDDKKKPTKPQDGRVITETRTDIVTDDACDCEVIETKRGFPKWALLGLAAIPIAFILIKRKKDTPTPTATVPGMTPTPTGTPSPTPSKTPTPTPSVTPTPTPPEPVPEPMTILLFGTGLASIGLAARRKFGKKSDESDEKEEE